MRIIAFLSVLLVSTLPAYALPSDEQFDALKNAPSPQHAESIEDDILMAMSESGSATADLVFERALLAERVGEYELARELMDRVLIIKPDFSEAWLRRAMIFLQDDQYDQAILDLNESLTHEPRNFRAWMALGRIFGQFQEDKQALDAYRKVLDIHPFYQPALNEVRRLEPIVNGRAI